MAWRKLGKKQREDNDYWNEVWQHIEEVITRQEVDHVIEATLAEIDQVIGKQDVAYGWSGGKDSQALRVVMDLYGIQNCVMGMSADMEYPQFLRWVTDHMPWELEIVDNPELTLAWLGQNEDLLFPQDSVTASKWFKHIQHRAQRNYFEKHKLNTIILGRRRGDSNYLGKDGLYTNKAGITRYSPIRDWSHEQVMGACYYHGYDLPPTYDWPNGWVVGTGAWPARQWVDTVTQGWYETYLIDPTIVERAAEHINSAAVFLKELDEGNVRVIRLYRFQDRCWVSN